MKIPANTIPDSEETKVCWEPPGCRRLQGKSMTANVAVGRSGQIGCLSLARNAQRALVPAAILVHARAAETAFRGDADANDGRKIKVWEPVGACNHYLPGSLAAP